ncbi:hypothetical protein CIPAW_12G040600 [Carya illinoinensis]|uniref:Uncharacterized protein n=1 Tax=Carya illinoinensis TaxID=32201 RepID=A0A8T1NWZ1_CARIL|nr:hypothetical protein CIPAW_12G040600 [Carya illinoinensis]
MQHCLKIMSSDLFQHVCKIFFVMSISSCCIKGYPSSTGLEVGTPSSIEWIEGAEMAIKWVLSMW